MVQRLPRVLDKMLKNNDAARPSVLFTDRVEDVIRYTQANMVLEARATRIWNSVDGNDVLKI